MTEVNEKLTKENVTRRAALAAAAAGLAGAVLPKEAHADSSQPTRKDVAKVSFEIANYKSSADKFERVPNKSGEVSASSTDDTYPTAEAVYEFTKDKVNYTQEVADAGKSLFVGSDGKVNLQTYTVDSELKEDSSNPVQGDVVCKAIKEVAEAVNLDEKPTKHEDTSSEATKDLKYVCKSNGYVVTYQQAQSCPSDFTTCEMGVNYTQSGRVITSNEQKWGVNRIDDAYIALCEDEFSGMYLSNKTNAASTWVPPQAIWHT